MNQTTKRNQPMKNDGAYDYRNRVYSATLGRFLQTDPIRFEAGDGNLYRYVGNNSTHFTDPSGLKECCPDELANARAELIQCKASVDRVYNAVRQAVIDVFNLEMSGITSTRNFEKNIATRAANFARSLCRRIGDADLRLGCMDAAEAAEDAAHGLADAAFSTGKTIATAAKLSGIAVAKSGQTAGLAGCLASAFLKCSNL